jgi:hypothetical protein
MAIKYFKKINLQNTITDITGKAIVFEPTNDANGVVALDDAVAAPLIADLDKFADARLCGVVRVSKEIYDALLKKKASTPSRRQLDRSSQLRLAKQPDPFSKSQKDVVVAGTDGNPKPAMINSTPEIPPTFAQFRQRVRRLTEEEKKG